MHKHSVFEEIVQKEKVYSKNKVEQIISPTFYNETLKRELIRKISNHIDINFKNNSLSDSINIANTVLDTIGDKEKFNFEQPLKRILYREQDEMPNIPNDFYLTDMNLVLNEKEKYKSFFKTLKYEMETGDGFSFMVSFIRFSGLQLLTRQLNELRDKGIKGRILTSVYMNITQPKALRKLLEYDNIEVKIYGINKNSFHTKAYLFHRNSGFNTAIIGSSNLSQSALKEGEEWNIKIPDESYIAIYKKALNKFDELWMNESNFVLTEDYIQQYERFLAEREKQSKYMGSFDYSKTDEKENKEIKPNSMQEEALKNLKKTREKGHKRALAIAATGTGKTYLSAFDAKEFNPQKLLFIAHRDELLNGAKETFRDVFKDDSKLGKLTGTEKEFEKEFLFSSIQTISKDENLNRFNEEDFDYIIIDEFHHASSPTYLKVINYFKPKFLLGLTATPERMDGRDVLALCDYNVVFEVRLRGALEKELLCPFHYFGINDETVDYEKVNVKNGVYEEEDLVKKLNIQERVDYIINKITEYGYDGDKMHALGFCVNIKHAEYMSREFNKRGIKALYLTGSDNSDTRKKAIEALEDENDPLQIIFTVDIFNEGVDIPKLNLLLFLRPTESSTIFIQQLGRGLRKAENKEFVTILDFIGNYNKSFMIPLALSSNPNGNFYDKDSLRIGVEREFADFPGECYIEFDKITQRRILNKLDSIKLNSTEMIKNLYYQFKKEVGRSLEVLDFLYYESAPPLELFIKKYKSFLHVKKTMEDLKEDEMLYIENKYLLEVLERIESMYPAKWIYEFIILRLSKNKQSVNMDDIVEEIEYCFSIEVNKDEHKKLIIRSMNELSEKYKKQDWNFGTVEGESFIFDYEFLNLIKQEEYFKLIDDRVEYALIRYQREFNPHIYLQAGENLVLYKNYTREDVQYLSLSGAQKGSWREGVSRSDDNYFLFINLNKDDDIEDHLKYHDYFIDDQNFHWQTQNQTSHASNRGKDFIYHKERGKTIHLFVRKFKEMYGNTLPFIYLGEVEYVDSSGDKPMSIQWKLKNKVPDKLYIDLIK